MEGGVPRNSQCREPDTTTHVTTVCLYILPYRRIVLEVCCAFQLAIGTECYLYFAIFIFIIEVTANYQSPDTIAVRCGYVVENTVNRHTLCII